MNSLPQNPFIGPSFWGRQHELHTIYSRLLTQPPQCCVIIGETSFGKTTLLRHLAGLLNSAAPRSSNIEDKFTFVFLDCIPYTELDEMGDYASVKFWWDLYSQLSLKLHPEKPLSIAKPKMKAEDLKAAIEIKSELEDLIRQHPLPVIIVLDNFEGIAHLSSRDSQWLRSLAQSNCAYITSSRHLLYLQYDLESWQSPSPLWNLFSDPIYLGLMKEEEVNDFISQAERLKSFWLQEDIKFIKRLAGRHPELIRLVCSHLFERRLNSRQPLDVEELQFLEFTMDSDVRRICIQLWHGLTDPELWDVPRVVGQSKGRESAALSPYQKALIDIANGREITDKKTLFVLEQRGLIETRDGCRRIFAELMRQFVLKQAQSYKRVEPASPDQVETPGIPAFAYLEGKVYQYLKLHTGEVCDKEEIKQAIWGSEPPTNSALQKIIERIREKIEQNPNNPRYLIAVRGQGYVLREVPSDFDMG